jgi:L,D-transpeptidase ErfK/SrfK
MRTILKSVLLALLLLGSAACALPAPIGRDVIHEVKAGEDLYTIARKYGLAPHHVMWANDVSFKHPPKVGDRLLIPLRRIPPFAPGGTAIVLNLPERMLYLFQGGAVSKFYGVAIGGDEYPTPTGNFAIIAKEKNPTWDPPKWLNKKPIGPGPDNPLGDRWLQITPGMVGIHGTNDPTTIGGVASLGCVRLYPEGIHDLFDRVGVGTRVYVIYEQARVGQEEDGSLVWSFFPDPYHKGFATFQVQEALKEARSQGQDVLISDFEIEERMKEAHGVISPVFGQPVEVKSGDQVSKTSAYLKPTGNWLDAAVLQSRGYKISTDSKARLVKIAASDGKVVLVRPEKLPLNPLRVPDELGSAPFRVEGHKWKGKTWVPFPLVLDYFGIPYHWDSKAAVLELD